MTDLRALVERFRQKRVLVLGDIVADEYIMGRPARLSREAPVLVLEETGRTIRPGGATNTAVNLAALGAQTLVTGVIGDDDMGRRLTTVLQDAGIDTSGLIVLPHRPTTTKTRVVGKGTQEIQQQIVRIDRVDTSLLEPNEQEQLIRFVCHALDEVDALLISDYENGVISPDIISTCLPRARARGLVITVDSHGDLFRFGGVTAATPNQPEAEATLGRTFSTTDELARAGEEIRHRMGARGVLITRGNAGMALFEQDRPMLSLPIALEDELDARDPSGAGDTVSAVFTLCLVSGTSLPLAAFLGNVAGGEVVKKWGTATLTPAELVTAAEGARHRMPSLPDASIPPGSVDGAAREGAAPLE